MAGTIYILDPPRFRMEAMKCDKKGRLYLSTDLRSKYGAVFAVVELPDELLLLPLPDDPVAHLRELGKDLAGYSLDELKDTIAEAAVEEASM